MKYPMTKNTQKPLFDFLVRKNGKHDYYLYNDFDAALNKAIELSKNSFDIGLIYEVYFNTENRQFYGRNTFRTYEGKVEYDKHAKIDLHIEFYVNAGEWLNPINDWIAILNSSQ